MCTDAGRRSFTDMRMSYEDWIQDIRQHGRDLEAFMDLTSLCSRVLEQATHPLSYATGESLRSET
jgi:hypothetical protein